jgi:hypothetical protein
MALECFNLENLYWGSNSRLLCRNNFKTAPPCEKPSACFETDALHHLDPSPGASAKCLTGLFDSVNKA